MSIKIAGTGSCVPSLKVGNNDLLRLVDTSDEWITSRTGIHERRILKDESLLDIAEKAANAALKNAGVGADELDMILCTTIQGDYITPSLACLLQSRINAKCPAFDLNAACSGFIYALDVAASYFEAKKAKKILVVCAEQLSKFVDWEDRRTCVLFGDGAGAVVLTEGDGLLAIRLRTAGQADFLNIPAPLPKNPFSDFEAIPRKSFLSMNGQEIYKFAVSTVTEDAVFASEKAGIPFNGIDYFLLHQANGRIIEAVQTRVKQPKSKFPMNLCRMGNTSSASIPLLLDELNAEHVLKKGDILLMSAFGAGLTSGVCILRW